MNCWLLSLCLLVLVLTVGRAVELRSTESVTIQRKVNAEAASAASDEDHQPYVEQVAAKPKVFVLHNFLTNAERTHLIRLAAPVMLRSQVSGAKGEGVVDEIRTSYGMFIKRLHDPIVERIENRIALFTQVPVSHQEDIQVLRYQYGQTYRAHMDSGANYSEPGPQYRYATFLMYLSDVEEGGETAFPNGSEWIDPEIPKRLEASGVKFSDCAKGHVAYKPKAGDAVLFYSFHPNRTMDEAAMHAGCPVIKGIKWAAPVWINMNEYEMASFRAAEASRPGRVVFPEEPGLCVDSEPRCAEWAAAGECTKNPSYMVGNGELGACRRACGACTPCSPGDMDCINKNRKAGGFLQVDRSEMEWLGVKWWMGEEHSPEL